MHGAGFLVDATTGLMLAVAGLGAARLALAGRSGMPTDRLADGSHLSMGLGMAVMLSPGLVPGSPRWPWVALSAGWLVVLAAALLLGRDRSGHGHHAVAAASMLLMWLAMSPPDPPSPAGPVGDAGTGMLGMPGMTMRSGGGLSPTSFVALALFGLLLYRAAGLAGRVGIGLGPGYGGGPERSRTPTGPVCREEPRPAGPVARVMAPVWSHGCEVTMSLAMAGMLYLLV